MVRVDTLSANCYIHRSDSGIKPTLEFVPMSEKVTPSLEKGRSLIGEIEQDRLLKLPRWAHELIEQQRNELRIVRALTLLIMDEPQPMQTALATYQNPMTGFSMNAHTQQVKLGWSTGSSHGYGEKRTPAGGGSQGPGVLYATERDAWLALRARLVRKLAEELAKIDRAIERTEG